MVPDVFQIIVKEKGVFTNVTSPSTKAKLRILFEVAPLALMVEQVGAVNTTHAASKIPPQCTPATTDLPPPRTPIGDPCPHWRSMGWKVGSGWSTLWWDLAGVVTYVVTSPNL
jgi:hypothetical protein